MSGPLGVVARQGVPPTQDKTRESMGRGTRAEEKVCHRVGRGRIKRVGLSDAPRVQSERRT